MFHGRLGNAPGGSKPAAEVSYVRPHELEILGEGPDGTGAVTLSQTPTVGPNTRIEFQARIGRGVRRVRFAGALLCFALIVAGIVGLQLTGKP
ncbi:hypothetical protein HLB44_27725 [Aquincola sp. S2]|uniref:Uncharacterized protein n=1 Tax=Pseudaquabacterium terrae TaxID=2732868 RepID=A0ABX2EQ29_9BURK|nr:hypothetical protein [Aquabacterium terrae]NRF70802.1 hypothetical protein [Aquabacterium terrae]